MNALSDPEVVRATISGVAGIVVAVIDKLLIQPRPVIVGSEATGTRPETRPGWARSVILVLVTSIALWLILGGVRSVLPSPAPAVTITEPAAGQQIDAKVESTGAAGFYMSGTSSGVATKPDSAICLFVYAGGKWWPQSQVSMDQDGHWQGRVWVGSSQFPVKVGETVRIVAVVIPKGQVPAGDASVSDLRDLNPLAQSKIVELVIGSLQ